MNTNHTYYHFEACEQLSDYVHSFWAHINPTNEIEEFTFAPDGFFKIIIVYQNNKIVRYFITGLYDRYEKVSLSPNSICVGCRFRILAPEYLLNKSVAYLINQEESLDINYLNIKHFDLTNFEILKVQWEEELIKLINKKPHENKLRLSKLLYKSKGALTVTQVSEQIFWEQKQINRYLKKYIGPSLKAYMNIQRAYSAYFDIRQGDFSPSPNDTFYDQSHFIKEIKKHTGATPKKVFQNQNETFKQIRNIKKK